MVSVVLRSKNLLQWFLDSVHSQYTLPWCSIPCSISLVLHFLYHPPGAPLPIPFPWCSILCSISMVLHLPGAPLSVPFPWCSILCAISLVLHYLCHLLGAPFPVPPLASVSLLHLLSIMATSPQCNEFLLPRCCFILCTGFSQCNSMAVAVFTWLF